MIQGGAPQWCLLLYKPMNLLVKSPFSYGLFLVAFLIVDTHTQRLQRPLRHAELPRFRQRPQPVRGNSSVAVVEAQAPGLPRHGAGKGGQWRDPTWTLCHATPCIHRYTYLYTYVYVYMYVYIYIHVHIHLQEICSNNVLG